LILFSTGDSVIFLEKLFKERNIRPISNCRVQRITKDRVSLEYYTDKMSTETRKEDIPSKFNMFIPPFHGLDVWRKVQNLTDEKGMILINDHQQSIAYPNIFGVGVCVKLPAVEKTPVPTGAPKTGYMIESMGTAAIHNIQSMMRYESGKTKNLDLIKATLSALCIGDLGDSGSVFLLKPQMPPRTHELSMHGKFAKLAKIAFEKYFLYKVESGDTDPYYEKYMLELLGLKRTTG
jgi:NADH dehydrogenase FAD-containing subunit